RVRPTPPPAPPPRPVDPARSHVARASRRSCRSLLGNVPAAHGDRQLRRVMRTVPARTPSDTVAMFGVKSASRNRHAIEIAGFPEWVSGRIPISRFERRAQNFNAGLELN